MAKLITLVTSSIAMSVGLVSVALGQPQALPRSFVSSPDIYKVVAQNDQFKVIEVTWKPGQKDKLHAHPANAVYYLTDCSLRIHAPDGSFREAQPRAGYAVVQREIPGHVLENIGPADCKLVMFEPS